MRTNSHKPKVGYLLVKNEIVADKIQKEIQRHVSASADEVQESFARKKPRKSGVKQISNADNNIFSLRGNNHLNALND